MDLNAATVLLAIMGLMQALFGVAWVVAGTRLHLSRESSFLWAGFCLCIAVGAGLFVHPASHFIEALVLVRGVAVVLAATLLRRGIDAFLGLPRHTVESVVVVALYVLAALVVGLDREAQQTRAVAQAAGVGWVLMRAVQGHVAPLRAEFGWPVALVLCGVLTGIGLAFGGLGVLTVLGLNPVPVDQPSAPGVGFLAAMVVASALFNFLLGFLVVARVVRELQWQTRHDGLTGLYNRRAFDLELTREQQRCARRASRLAVLMIDVDHFKLINDSLGHSAGDAVLAAIAATLATGQPADRRDRPGGWRGVCAGAAGHRRNGGPVAGRALARRRGEPVLAGVGGRDAGDGQHRRGRLARGAQDAEIAASTGRPRALPGQGQGAQPGRNAGIESGRRLSASAGVGRQSATSPAGPRS